jgi:uncharacterized protein YdhG (YjbR/CyaY superfamily)
MAENKTRPTNVSVDDFLSTVSDARRAEARTLIELMQDISSEQPVIWGPSIIGFGTQHYKSEAGREGDMGILGFSPRKAALTIYFYEGFDRYGEELSLLGKHTSSQSCLYVNKLADIDLAILRQMLESSYRIATSDKEQVLSVDEYITAIPANARPKFDELRALVREIVPEYHEVMSYGIVAYKHKPDKRAQVFISGWKDHLAIYPVPKNPSMAKRLAPYIHGKGTLWFSLDEPLPRELIADTVRALL